MQERTQFYINGEWVDPAEPRTIEVINPATEEPIGRIGMGSAADVDKAVQAARAAFETYGQTSREQRLELMGRIVDAFKGRFDEIADTISAEMGAPTTLAHKAQAPTGIGHFKAAMRVLKDYAFEETLGTTVVRREPVGVCGFITPWNWPINQITCKVAPALAAGCTMVLKPSKVAPLNAVILAEVLHEAGVPAGVFNLINGKGTTVGAAMAAHPGIDMMSFTGSTGAGVAVAKAAADTVKRVAQELGGKSANIILDDADFAKAVSRGVFACMVNSGQSCNAPTRMLVPAARMDEAIEAAKAAIAKVKVGDPSADDTTMGPVVSETQFDKIQALIEKGIEEGATLVTGGSGRPEGLNRGYYVRPTVFANVDNDMTIAREEIFGPVLSILGYRDEDDAVLIANDTVYGLSGYVSSGNLEHARAIAARLRTGNVHINNAGADPNAPFGGYKMSGNGREWGEFGFEEFLEVKAVMGAVPAEAAE